MAAVAQDTFNALIIDIRGVLDGVYPHLCAKQYPCLAVTMNCRVFAVGLSRIVQRLQFRFRCQKGAWNTMLAAHRSCTEVFQEIRAAGDLLASCFENFLRRVRMNGDRRIIVAWSGRR